MDDKPGEQPASMAEPIAVTPDMRVSREAAHAQPSPTLRRRRRPMRPPVAIAAVAALVGVAALAATGWVYSDMRREIVRLSTDVAQLRLSLDLYVQRDGGSSPSAVAESAGASQAAIETLENRLSILEENWRGAATGAGQPASLPPISGPAVSAQSDGDCLPSGMRILVTSGDAYPVCGTDATVRVMNVSNGYISLTDGTTVPSGSAVPLVGTACMIGVTSGGDEATTGYAEIRVSC
ncbi:hypothetical protein SAMN05216456_2685 [Devosia crocina]|uniref:Uncharacterized protein n=1 Tax=Devosia crocina TaxID=429728 RepID=A0A1I7NQS7_9HYPH|nr:hypothetical protein [Devosia crocina]SFV36975.1 hypothetical protein SAMN05216456_2685 [Devosia crocina]